MRADWTVQQVVSRLAHTTTQPRQLSAFFADSADSADTGVIYTRGKTWSMLSMTACKRTPEELLETKKV